MKKYSKKIALILTLALVLAIAIPALAVTTTITGAYEENPVDVIVPGSVTATLNPYSLPVKIYSDAYADYDPDTDDIEDFVIDTLDNPGQIATQPLVGVNMGSVPLKVSATVTGQTKGNFKFVTSAPSTSAKTNTGLVYLQVKQSEASLAYNIDHDTNTAMTEVAGGFDGTSVVAALDGWTLPTGKYNAKAAGVLTVGTKAATKEMCTIAAVSEDDGAPQAGSYFMARLTGNIVKKPTKSWQETDGFVTTIVWDFEPAT